MQQMINLLSHEFRMSIRRPGLWIANMLVMAFYGAAILIPGSAGPDFFSGMPWQDAGQTVQFFSILMPLVAGILVADRMQRDFRLGLRDLQISTPIKRPTYILGKYLGVLFSSLLPMLIGVVSLGVFVTLSGQTTATFLVGILVAFLAIALPSFVFVTAFSLVCPLFMPLRVYQILFTGYWFWGNFLNAEVFPTISDTLLNAAGIYPLEGFFLIAVSQSATSLHTPLEAWLNILVLSLCAASALFFLIQYLSWQAKHA
jgi:ABC-2 type transport system permease protein